MSIYTYSVKSSFAAKYPELTELRRVSSLVFALAYNSETRARVEMYPYVEKVNAKYGSKKANRLAAYIINGNTRRNVMSHIDYTETAIVFRNLNEIVNLVRTKQICTTNNEIRERIELAIDSDDQNFLDYCESIVRLAIPRKVK